MKRLHLFEFHDYRWFPLRDALTDLLMFQIQRESLYRPIYSLLRRALRESGSTHIIDLGSGSGGPLVEIVEWLAATDYPVSVLLTDRYPPNRSETTKLPYYPTSVDARQISPDLTGFRTLFTVFHHFRPEEASAILQDSVLRRAPIAIFEFTERRWRNVIGMLLSPISVWADEWRLKPRRFVPLFWTYCIPLLPLIYWWDGTVSHLRTYTMEELHAMTQTLQGGETYQWEIGQEQSALGAITYLLGWKTVEVTTCMVEKPYLSQEIVPK